MNANPLVRLTGFGQSLWMDFIRRGTIESGELQRFVDEDGVRGVTSNPSIFEKAIAGSHDYDVAVRALSLQGKGAEEIVQALVLEDIRRAADLLRPIYDRLGGRDGFVSLEVSPGLARDTAGTIGEARALWRAVDRPNVMIKVPATHQGLLAIQQLTTDGINVNVTLLFGIPRYRQVVEAYIAGLETRVRLGQPLDTVASVASFFLSRIDVLVDPMLEKVMQAEGPGAELAARLHGEVAIASAKAAYDAYRTLFTGERFQKLAAEGAHPQRLLWASTSTKNPSYSDVKYVEPLIGPETVNTMPVETLHAYRHHGNPAPRLADGLDQAAKTLADLAMLGLDLDQLTRQLEEQGVEHFLLDYDLLLKTIDGRRQQALQEPVDRQTYAVGKDDPAVQRRLADLDRDRFCDRLWRKDPTLWKSDARDQRGIREAMGWLHVAEKMQANLPDLLEFASEVQAAGFKRVVHVGMGGSSLAALAFERTFPVGQRGLPLTVLDTTDPETIRRVEAGGRLEETLFLVATKSGTTAEAVAFGDYFHDRVKAVKGARAGDNFVAITDPGSALASLAQRRSFRHTFLNFADIGGRYSALSYFGLVPAALMGVDVGELLIRASRMAHSSASCVADCDNPGVTLGAVLGQLAASGRNKVTFVIPAQIASLGMWLEQLLAESTGKEGKGLLPVAGEPLGPPSVYAKDRVFVHFKLLGDSEPDVDQALEGVRAAGFPLISIHMDDPLDLGQEFFRWEVATATVASLMRINPFDQPNVQESKDNTDRLLTTVRDRRALPEPEPGIREGPLSLFGADGVTTAVKAFRRFLSQADPRSYLGLLAYLPEEPEIDRTLQALRIMLRDRLRAATTLGYGPRYLHSTGQFHKGGVDEGLFLQLTAEHGVDVPVASQPYTFSVFNRAQALGDLEALRRHGRRAMRVHLGADVRQGLEALRGCLEEALKAEERSEA
jgi:transaldolase/glucose-6-phosphate isomerase